MQPQREQLLLLLLLVGVSSLLDVAKSDSVSYIGDVVVYQNETVWKCDHVICPAHTHRCHISKQKDPADASVLLRENTCYGRNDNILHQKITREAVDPHQSVSLNVDSYRNGVITSTNSNYNSVNMNSNTVNSNTVNSNTNTFGNVPPAVERDININVAKIQQEVNQNLNRIHHEVQQNMRDIQHQLSAMQHNLQASLQNMFH